MMRVKLNMLIALSALISISSAEFNIDEVQMGTLNGVTFNKVGSMKATDDGKTVYVLDDNALWTMDFTTRQKELIVGSTEAGYVEGVGDEARLKGPGGLEIKGGKAYIADSGNQCLRTVDLATRNMSWFAGQCGSREYARADGTRSEAKFSYPDGLLFHKDELLVTEYYNKNIRLIASDSVSTVVIGPWYPGPIHEIDGKVYFTTRAGLHTLDVEGKTFELITGDNTREGFVDGPLSSARFSLLGDFISPSPGIILLAAANNNRIRVVDLENGFVSSICTGTRGLKDGGKDECEMTRPDSFVRQNNLIYIGANIADPRPLRILSQGIIEACPAPNIDVSLEPGDTAGKVILAELELMAPVGDMKLVTKLSDGTTCNTTINVVATEVVCPSTISAEIPAGATSVSVTWQLPSTSGIDGDEIECVSCPSTPKDLPAGLHKIEYEYKYKPSQAMIGCTFEVLVFTSAKDCTSETKKCSSGLSKGKQNAVFNLNSADGNTTPIEFPVGINTLEIVSESGLTCTETIEVIDTTPVRSSVDLVVKYAVDCDNLNAFSWAVINSSLLHHYTNLVYACEDCGLPESVSSPGVTCETGILSVAWPTNITFTQEETDPWPATKADLVSKLMKVQEDHVKLTGRYFVITVIMQNPPVVPPTKGVDDLYVYPEVVSSCPIEELVYDEEDDACYNSV